MESFSDAPGTSYSNQRENVCDENNSSQRWSHMENNDDVSFEEMGVSLLKDNSDTVSNDTSEDSQGDIENCNPAALRGIKRTCSAGGNADNDLDPPSKVPSVSLRHSPKRYILSPNHANICNVQNGNFSNSSHVDIFPKKPEEYTHEFQERLKSSGNFEKIYDFKDNLVNEDSQISHDKNFKQGERKRFAPSQSDHKINENVIDQVSNSVGFKNIVEHNSPLASCGPHPPFHKYTQSMQRHSTFDDENIQHEKNDVINIMNLSKCGEFKTNDELSNSESVNVTSESNKNCCHQHVNCKHINEKNQSNDGKRENSKLEKECFVANRFSFCDSCKDVNDSSPSQYSSVNSPESENGASKLFDEDVLSIFSWLPKKTLVRCMLVCKRWHRIALDSTLWTKVCLAGKVLPSGVIPNLMSRHPIIVRLANAQIVAPVLPQSIISHVAWRVQYLDLSAASITPLCLASILKLCPALLRLSLEGLSMSEDASVALGRLTQLKVLNLALVTGLGKEGAKSIVQLTNVEALNVAWTGLNSDAMKLLCEGLPNTIERLNLSGFRKSLTDDSNDLLYASQLKCTFRQSITSTVVVSVVSRCPNLIELDLSDCVMLNDKLIPTLSNLTKMEHLAISRCNRLKMKDIATLNLFESLQFVDMFGLVTPYNINSFQNLLPKIQLNHFQHSAVARPTVGNRRSSIWGLRTRD